ncbi:pyridoxal phosphate-dependent aminotransferase [Haloferax sulfurifontis]|uniref:Aminotransferase n=1 Tax=Haloferax sulfurifontis TaxID=255616 RepID=A0A830E3H4_9EURY|nr:pyridoxal phosphate-dependent aminotransferase [Haloferax sulfurifontis]GGC50761.1 aminotransferase [Haloferax sulfurifontis]
MMKRPGLSGLSTRMPQSGIREVFDAAQSYDDLADLSIGEPDFATPEPIAAAVCEAVGTGASSYTETVGRPELRAALAEKLAVENGIDAAPESEIIVTPGAMGALFAAVNVLCDPGDEVLVPEPYWPNYHGHVASANARLASVSTDEEFVPTPDAVEAAVSDDTTAILLNSPGNPTGAVIPPDRLRALDDVAAEHGLWVVADETYEDLVYDGATHHSLASDGDRFDRIVTVHSFSKSYAMTGWRIGYASAPERVIDAMRVLQEHTVSSVPEPAQVAASAALANRYVVGELREAFAERRRLVLDRLAAIDGIDPGTPRGAFYVFADVSAHTTDSRAFVERLMSEAGVASVPGAVFGAAGEGYVRFSYAADVETLTTAMDRLERAL